MRVSAWQIDRTTGRLDFDREWALIDAHGEVMRLSRYPALASIQPRVDPAARTLTLRAHAMAPLVLPLDAPPASAPARQDGRAYAHPTVVDVCGEACSATGFGGALAAEWLAQAVGVQCVLVRSSRPLPRPSVVHSHDGTASLDGGHSGGGADAGHPRPLFSPSSGEQQLCAPSPRNARFANEAPLLLLSQTSLDALNAVLRAHQAAPVTASHFRPNLLVTGGEGGSSQVVDGAEGESGGGGPENGWSEVSLADGGVVLRVAGPCARCSMVEVDPVSGVKHGAVLRALARHHRSRARILFGVFCEAASDDRQRAGDAGRTGVALSVGTVVVASRPAS